MIATFDQLSKNRPPFKDVLCKAWDCDVRLQKLDGPDKLRMVELTEGLEKDDDGNVLDKQAGYEFGLELLARSIVDDEGTLQFAAPAARQWLSGEIEAVAELLDEAIELNGLGADDEVEQKKSDSTGPPHGSLLSDSA